MVLYHILLRKKMVLPNIVVLDDGSVINSVDGSKVRKIGSKREVWHGKAWKTSGGSTYNDLRKLSSGRLVSKKEYENAMQNWCVKHMSDDMLKLKIN